MDDVKKLHQELDNNTDLFIDIISDLLHLNNQALSEANFDLSSKLMIIINKIDQSR